MKSSNPYTTRPKPLSINELLNNDNDFNPAFPSFEEPMNYHSHIQNLINRTKNVEAEMIRDYNHGQLLFNEFFRLLETTEMVAFDIMYVDCLWGGIEFKDFYEFIQKCRDANFVFYRPTDQDIQQAAEHIRYLHSNIHTCCEDFRKFDPRTRIDPPQRPYKIYTYLDDLTKTIEEDILRVSEIKKHEQAEIEYDYGFDASVYDTISLPNNSDKFNKWLTDFVQPSHDSNQNIAPNRSLLGMIFHKMNVIKELKEEIQKMRKETVSPKDMGPLDLDPQVIQNCPFYKAAMGNASFLRLAINNFLSEQPEIDMCEASIENSFNSFSKLQHPCQETLKASEKIQEEIRDSIAKKQKQLKDTMKDNMGYYDLLSDNNIERIYTLIDDITNLDKEVTDILESEQSKQVSLGSASTTIKISDFVPILQEMRDMRENLIGLCKECAEERKDESIYQKKLFTLVKEFLVHDEKQRIYEKMPKTFDCYKGYLDEVHKLFNKEPVFQWCHDVNAALDEMEKVLNEHDELVKVGNDDNENYNDDGEDEIKRLELEIEQLEKELSDVNYEKIQLKEEVDKKKEELFDQIQMNDMYIIYQGSNLQKTERLKESKKSVLCSVCNSELCEVVIKKEGCHHPFCRKCIELDSSKDSGQCPICGAHYTNDMLLEFSFNPKSS